MDSASLVDHSTSFSLPSDTLDLLEAAHYLRMHPVTLRNKMRAGAVPGAKVGKRWVFLRIDLERYIRSKYSARAMQGDSHEEIICHSTSEKTPRIGGSSSVATGKQYREALGLKTS